ncbi:MAG: amidohydrolase family protein [Deltaproteobacteria bacterium]|nr:amidohydrolase family protein [Deltaproteobacteria bacterium]
MAYDRIIAGGRIVDGTGSPPRQADLAIQDGLIAAIGDLAGAEANERIDASGCIVTPGFVDLHTHFDGQISWDDDLMPSSIHGTTTVVLGNCGVGFAPCRESDREALIALMEGVEDIPGSALAEGLRWDWQTFPEYMSALDVRPKTIDYALQVPHDALRVFVMGERGIAGEPATDDDVAAMRAHLREALLAGAAGFSTGRSDNHRSRTGAATPASEANERELVGLAGAFDGVGHGILQAVSDFDLAAGPDSFEREFDVIERMADAAPGHTLSVSLSQRDQAPDQWKRILARAEAATDKGLPIRVLTAPRGIGVILGLEATFHPFIGFPSYKRIAHLPLAERVAAMRSPEFRARLLAEKSEPIAGDGSSVPPIADWLLAQIDRIAFRFFTLGEKPNYEPKLTDSLGARAKARGVSALEAILDALLDDEGHALIYFPVYNYAEWNLENVRAMMTHPLALPGLSDSGAHVGTICDASFPTFLLAYWARDRETGRIPLERVVQMITSDTARYLGLADRGRLEVGLRADVNVIDHERLRLHPPRMVADLPAGGKRLIQAVDGYRMTLVRGEPILEDGRLTGRRPGRLVRLGAR